MTLRLRERVEERARCEDGKLAREREEVLVAGDEDRSLRFGEGEEVVVAWVGGTTHGRFWVGCGPRRLPWKLDEREGLVFYDALPDLRVRESPPKLGEERVRDDELELAGQPARDDQRRRSASGKD